MLTLYWVTVTITPSMRDYFGNRWHGAHIQPGDRVQVPVGFANFDNNHVTEASPPREWAERLYNVRRWTSMPSGRIVTGVPVPRCSAGSPPIYSSSNLMVSQPR